MSDTQRLSVAKSFVRGVLIGATWAFKMVLLSLAILVVSVLVAIGWLEWGWSIFWRVPLGVFAAIVCVFGLIALADAIENLHDWANS